MYWTTISYKMWGDRIQTDIVLAIERIEDVDEIAVKYRMKCTENERERLIKRLEKEKVLYIKRGYIFPDYSIINRLEYDMDDKHETVGTDKIGVGPLYVEVP